MRCIRGRSQYSETSLRNIAAKTSQWNAIAKSHGETPRRDSTMKHHGGAHREALQQNVTAKYIGEALRRKAASKANRKMAPPRGWENSLPVRRRVRSTKKERCLSFFVWIFGYSPLFASVSAVRARKRRDYYPEFANCQFIGNRGFSSPDFVPSGEAAVFSVPDALLRSPALFADEISYSARSELILVLCTILAKAPISRAAQ